jgi:tetratricopeptide (TPR) repeat protein
LQRFDKRPETETTLRRLFALVRNRGIRVKRQGLRPLFGASGVPDPEGIAVYDAAESLADVLFDNGKYADAEAFLRRAALLSNPAADPERVPRLNYKIAMCLERIGRAQSAERLLRSSIDALSKLRTTSSVGANEIRVALALLLEHRGKTFEAERLYEQVLRRRMIGDRTDLIAFEKDGGDAALPELNGGDVALTAAEQLASLRRARGTYPRSDFAALLSQLAQLRAETGKYTESEAALQEAIDIEERAHPTGDRTAHYFEQLAVLYVRANRLDEAERFLARSVQIREQKLDDPYYEQDLWDLRKLYQMQGKTDLAEQLVSDSLTTLRT